MNVRISIFNLYDEALESKLKCIFKSYFFKAVLWCQFVYLKNMSSEVAAVTAKKTRGTNCETSIPTAHIMSSEGQCASRRQPWLLANFSSPLHHRICVFLTITTCPRNCHLHDMHKPFQTILEKLTLQRWKGLWPGHQHTADSSSIRS